MYVVGKQNIYAVLGNHLRKARVSKGLSGQELAGIIQLSQQQISRYELGINKLSLDKLIEIAIFLDIDINEITKMIINNLNGKEKLLHKRHNNQIVLMLKYTTIALM
ncbi:helix-turn-helix domain-containing protein [Providencia rustigianii]|uniref:helix-turn-helix domain-containing protein n=1 Tax=Providencia rustigianii TaxID=158850 RepID=UPI000D841EE8|nr:transcriptional regulator, y4mF family [Providencia rustigianii]